MNNKYLSDIILGERYKDNQTGIEGIATVTAFFQHGCERVTLEFMRDQKIEEVSFDAPRLTHVETGKTASVTKTGGPAKGNAHEKPEVGRR
jgi:hypothetical protein